MERGSSRDCFTVSFATLGISARSDHWAVSLPVADRGKDAVLTEAVSDQGTASLTKKKAVINDSRHCLIG